MSEVGYASDISALTDKDDKDRAKAGKKQKSEENEEEALDITCKGIIQFFEKLKIRGTADMSEKSKEVINDLKTKISDYVKSDVKEPSSQGAIPKTRKIDAKKKVDPTNKKTENYRNSDEKVNTTASSLLSDSSSGCKLSSNSEVRMRKGKSKKYMPRDSSLSLRKLLEKFDNRHVPKQTPFDEDSGKELSVYLRQFEEYCSSNFRGNKDFWLGELETLLRGKTLENFRVIMENHEGYETVREKLLDWFRDFKRNRRGSARLKFRNSKMEPTETLYRFSTRLESLFKIAYPKHDTTKSTTLLYQFMNNVPKPVQEMLRVKVMEHKLVKRKVEWKYVQKIARIRDAEANNVEESPNESNNEDRVIRINLNRNSARSDQQSRSTLAGENRDARTFYSRNHNSRGRTRSGRWPNIPQAVFCDACNRFGHVAASV